MELFECVPNISEGRDQLVIDELEQIVRNTEDCFLLRSESGYDANRTVLTFVGSYDGIKNAVKDLYRYALENMDMQKQTGKHPRQGAIDVCPIIALQNASIERGLQLVNEIGQSLKELDIPIYYYEHSAPKTHSHLLADLRKGSYEKRYDKIAKIPLDLGSSKNIDRFGISCLGLRDILIAYNINVLTKDISIVKQIANEIREFGASNRTNSLSALRAIGWYIEEFGHCQLSCNLVDHKRSGMLEVFKTCKKLADNYNIELGGSELIGLAPLIEFQKISPDAKLKEQIELTSQFLGLNSLSQFKPNERILELAISSLNLPQDSI